MVSMSFCKRNCSFEQHSMRLNYTVLIFHSSRYQNSNGNKISTFLNRRLNKHIGASLIHPHIDAWTFMNFFFKYLSIAWFFWLNSSRKISPQLIRVRIENSRLIYLRECVCGMSRWSIKILKLNRFSFPTFRPSFIFLFVIHFKCLFNGFSFFSRSFLLAMSLSSLFPRCIYCLHLISQFLWSSYLLFLMVCQWDGLACLSVIKLFSLSHQLGLK